MSDEILFVDDDRFFTKSYVRRLVEADFQVHRIDYPGDVIEFIKSHPALKLIILDIMMPTPQGVAQSATSSGMDTGLWLLNEIRGEFRKRQIPVVILTNRDEATIGVKLEEMGLTEGLILVRPKSRTATRELPKIVRDHLNSSLTETT